MSEKISYDRENDILYIHQGGSARDSLPVGDFIVEFSGDNRVVGLEVLNASENINVFLDEEISAEDLENIVDARLSYRESHGMGIIFLVIVIEREGERREEKVSVNMPSAVPQVPA